MRAHDADDVVKQRRHLVRAGGHDPDEHLHQRTHHLLDLGGVILGDSRVAHRVEEYVRDNGDSAVLAAHERRDEPRHVVLRVSCEALLYGLPLVGVCADERQDELLNVVLRGVDLGAGGEYLGEELFDEDVKEFALGHDVAADAGDDLIRCSARGHGDVFEVVDAVFARVFEGVEYCEHVVLELGVVCVELRRRHDVVNAVAGKAHALGRYAHDEVVVVYDVVDVFVYPAADLVDIRALGSFKGVDIHILRGECDVPADGGAGHEHIVECAAEEVCSSRAAAVACAPDLDLAGYLAVLCKIALQKVERLVAADGKACVLALETDVQVARPLGVVAAAAQADGDDCVLLAVYAYLLIRDADAEGIAAGTGCEVRVCLEV